MSDWESQPAIRPEPIFAADLVSYRKVRPVVKAGRRVRRSRWLELFLQENMIWLSATFGVFFVTGLIGCLLLALTPEVSGDCERREEKKSSQPV